MPIGPKAPSPREVTELAHGFGIELGADEAESYAKMMGGALHDYRHVEARWVLKVRF